MGKSPKKLFQMCLLEKKSKRRSLPIDVRVLLKEQNVDPGIYIEEVKFNIYCKKNHTKLDTYTHKVCLLFA